MWRHVGSAEDVMDHRIGVLYLGLHKPFLELVLAGWVLQHAVRQRIR
jgi:hypothetical protein